MTENDERPIRPCVHERPISWAETVRTLIRVTAVSGVIIAYLYFAAHGGVH